MKEISKLHCITNELNGLTHEQMVRFFCMGGAKWVQLRIKNKNEEEAFEVASKIKDVCDEFNACLIINDYVGLVKRIGATGVHLGKLDMPPDKARQVLGDDYVIGGTANTFEDIKLLVKQGADYIGLGPYRFTKTKQNFYLY